MIRVEWDLTPSWWGDDWWRQHEPRLPEFAHLGPNYRRPEAVAYAIEEVLRWVHPGATVQATNLQFLARFDIESEESYLAALRDRARTAGARYEYEPDLKRYESIESYRDDVAGGIEDISRPWSGGVHVRPRYPHCELVGSGGQYYLMLRGLPGDREVYFHSHQGDNLTAMHDVFARATAELDSLLSARSGEGSDEHGKRR